MVVSPDVHHQRTVKHVGQLQAWRENRVAGSPIGGNIHGRQITEMAIPPGLAVMFGTQRVQMAAGGQRGHGLSVSDGRRTARVLMHVKAVESGRQSDERRVKHEAVLSLDDPNHASGSAVAARFGNPQADRRFSRMSIRVRQNTNNR
jgi:hypothetical protein